MIKIISDYLIWLFIISQIFGSKITQFLASSLLFISISCILGKRGSSSRLQRPACPDRAESGTVDPWEFCKGARNGNPNTSFLLLQKCQQISHSGSCSGDKQIHSCFKQHLKSVPLF